MREPIISYRRHDFRVEWYSGSGAGGQHRNKHQNCCRIIHIATDLRAQGTAHRDRPSNQREAFHRLAGMLLAHLDQQAERRIGDEVVRTYHVERNEVIDHGSGERMPVPPVLDGDLKSFRERAGNQPLPRTGRVR